MSEHAQAEPVQGPAGVSLLSSFLSEAADVWKRLPHKLLFALLLAAWFALFHILGNATMGYAPTSSLFWWAYSNYITGEDDAHGPYVPLAVLLFFWIKRKELAQVSARIWWPALVYFLAALALHFVAFRVQQARISIIAFTLGIHALIGLVWGREALRRTIFPIFLLFFCVPLGTWADPLTLKLRILVTKISVGIGHNILGIDVFQDGSQILGRTGRAMYDVAPACSGMRSLTAMTALAVIYAFLNLDRPIRRFALIVCALPLALFANIVRITTVIIVGEAFGQSVATKIEQKFGFVTFAVAIGGMMALAWLMRERDSAAREQSAVKPVELEEVKPV